MTNSCNVFMFLELHLGHLLSSFIGMPLNHRLYGLLYSSLRSASNWCRQSMHMQWELNPTLLIIVCGDASPKYTLIISPSLLGGHLMRMVFTPKFFIYSKFSIISSRVSSSSPTLTSISSLSSSSVSNTDFIVYNPSKFSNTLFFRSQS